MFLSLRASAHTGVAIRFPRPRAAGAAPLFTFASGGHLSFNSERKVRKNATKTYGFGFPQRAAPCRKFVSYFLAQSPFPCAVVRQKDCATTAFRCRFAAAACCHGRSFPLYRRDGERAINGILAAQRAAPTPAAAGAAAGARFDNRPPHRERVSKGRGRARPFPLDASFHSAAADKSNPPGGKTNEAPPVAGLQ